METVRKRHVFTEATTDTANYVVTDGSENGSTNQNTSITDDGYINENGPINRDEQSEVNGTDLEKHKKIINNLGSNQEPIDHEPTKNQRKHADFLQQEGESVKDTPSKAPKYGSILLVLICVDLMVNYLIIQISADAQLEDSSENISYSNAKTQMFWGSVLRCAFSFTFMILVATNRMHSKYPKEVYYILQLVYYLGYTQLLLRILIDSEKSDFTDFYRVSYWCQLTVHAVCLSCHLTVVLLTWREWKERVTETSDKKTKNGKLDANEISENVKTNLPAHILAKKLMKWFRMELFGIENI